MGGPAFEGGVIEGGGIKSLFDLFCQHSGGVVQVVIVIQVTEEGGFSQCTGGVADIFQDVQY